MSLGVHTIKHNGSVAMNYMTTVSGQSFGIADGGGTPAPSNYAVFLIQFLNANTSAMAIESDTVPASSSFNTGTINVHIGLLQENTTQNCQMSIPTGANYALVVNAFYGPSAELLSFFNCINLTSNTFNNMTDYNVTTKFSSYITGYLQGNTSGYITIPTTALALNDIFGDPSPNIQKVFAYQIIYDTQNDDYLKQYYNQVNVYPSDNSCQIINLH